VKSARVKAENLVFGLKTGIVGLLHGIAALHRGVVRLHYGIVGLQYGIGNGHKRLLRQLGEKYGRFNYS
jgi:hypothetical protein